MAVARELTKLHETVYRGELATVEALIAGDSFGSTGEFVLVVAPAPPAPRGEEEIRTMLQALRAPHLPRSRAVEVTTGVLACSRNEVYRIALTLRRRFRPLSLANQAGAGILQAASRLDGRWTPVRGWLEESPGSIGQGAR